MHATVIHPIMYLKDVLDFYVNVNYKVLFGLSKAYMQINQSVLFVQRILILLYISHDPRIFGLIIWNYCINL